MSLFTCVRPSVTLKGRKVKYSFPLKSTNEPAALHFRSVTGIFKAQFDQGYAERWPGG